jgi:Transposase, Mutator family
MTATLNDVPKKIKQEPTAEQLAAQEMVARAREQGLSLTGPDGLLKQLTKTVLETALNQELTEHLRHDKHGLAQAGNVRNGTRSKTVLTEASGQVQIEVPRDRAGTFEPQIVRKRQRRLTGVDEIVLSLYARGLTTGEISAHFEEIYGASASASARSWPRLAPSRRFRQQLTTGRQARRRASRGPRRWRARLLPSGPSPRRLPSARSTACAPHWCSRACSQPASWRTGRSRPARRASRTRSGRSRLGWPSSARSTGSASRFASASARW